MSENEQVKTDPWQRALGPAHRTERIERTERTGRRPRPGPGRHRPSAHRVDPWLRALTGPPISESQPVS